MNIKQILKPIFILILILGMLACSDEGAKDEYHILIPGVGYDNFRLGKTTLEDITKENGKNYRLDTFYRKTDRNKPLAKAEIYSMAACYDSLGVRYFFFPSDSVIFSIILRPPFKGKTKEGIILNESNFADIVKIYGELPWGYAPERMTKSADGIWFTQKSNCTYESSDKDKEACLLNKVCEISIVEFE